MSFSFVVNPNWVADAKPELREFLEVLGKSMVADAQRIVPVATGHLRDSIDSEVDDTTLYIYASADYAPDVELGTSKMKAQPYLRPAVFKNHGEVQ